MPIDYAAIEAAVREAGQQMLSAHVTPEAVSTKEGAANFVTTYDVKNQQLLISRFSRILPEAKVFGEEETEGSSHVATDRGYVFYIDPIDGTTNFMFGLRHSNVSVGLMLDGRMVAGWVYVPYTDEMYTAVRGEGARLNGQPIRIADRHLSEGIAFFGCARYYNEGREDAVFDTAKAIFRQALALRCGGSAAMDICRTAASASVAYFELFLSPYDYAAASVIVEEAGGVITQIDGSPLTFDHGCSVVAGVPLAAGEVRAIAMPYCSEA